MSVVAAVAATFVSLALAPSAVRADDLPDDQMAPNQFSGVVNADNVYVRSYAGESEYAVTKLNKGDPVVVVGVKGDWLKVLPPDGVFCLVGKAWVEARSNGLARVRDDAVVPNVRIASLLGPSYGRVAVTLKPGQDVKLIGQLDENFKIAPPPGAFAYIHKRFVDPVKKVEVITDHGTMRVKSADTADNTKPTPPDDGLKPVPPIVKVDPTTKPAGPDNGGLVAINPPATRPTTDKSPTTFDALEAKLVAAGKMPLDQQPIDELLAGYRTLAADTGQPDAIRQYAQTRVKNLEIRQDALKSFADAEAARKQREATQVPLEAEAKEISQRIAANDFKRYDAVGTVRSSSLPSSSGHPLYRLTDPSSGRTVIYLDDAKGDAAKLDGQFVGVRGAISDDSTRQIKLLTPTAVETVDPADLKSGAATSAMLPPSLSATADAGH